MPDTVLNPAGLHDPNPYGYSHSASVPAGTGLVFVAGQYGSKADGSVISPHFSEQVRQALHNLGPALAAHGVDRIEQLGVSDESFRDEPGRTLAELLRAECMNDKASQNAPRLSLRDLIRGDGSFHGTDAP